jgi:hypothetical protein
VPGCQLRGTPRVDRMAIRKLVFERMVQDIYSHNSHGIARRGKNSSYQLGQSCA